MENLTSNEIWKDIKGYESLYQISNKGNIFSKRKNKNLAKTDNGKGYKLVSFHTKGKRKNFYVHRLVAEAFIENPNNFKTINHKDFDRSNNEVTNLEWCTQLHNVRYSVPNMCHRKASTRSNTGYEYITEKPRVNTNAYYVTLRYDNKSYYSKPFKTLQEAIKYRDELYKYEKTYYKELEI